MALPGYLAGSLSQLVPVGIGLVAGGSNYTVNSATLYAGFLFNAAFSVSMTGFGVAFSGTTGTVTNGCEANLYAVDSNGNPTGSSLATVTFTPSGTMTPSWGTPYTLTAGTVYAVVLQNVLGAPASNYFAVNNQTWADVTCSDRIWLWSANAGASWQGTNMSQAITASGLYPIYSGHSGYGALSGLQVGPAGNNSGLQLYNTSGTRIAAGALRVNFPYKVRLWAVVAPMSVHAGSPSYSIEGSVWNAAGTQLSQSSGSVLATNTTFSGTRFNWTTPYALNANTDYYIGVTPTTATAGDSSDYVGCAIVNNGPFTTGTFGPAIGFYYSTSSTISWTACNFGTVGQSCCLQILVEVEGNTGASGVPFKIIGSELIS